MILWPALAAAQTVLPLKHKPEPTHAAISAADLMTRLYIYADDSMEGRRTGTPGHVKATNYIEGEVRKLGLKPAGDKGGYFQNVPVVQRSVDPNSMLMVGSGMLMAMEDFVPAGAGRGGDPRSLNGVSSIYGGVQGDTVQPLTADQVRGKLVIFSAAPGGTGRGRGVQRAAGAGASRGPALPRSEEAAGTATVVGDALPEALVRAARPTPGNGPAYRDGPPAPPSPATLSITTHAAEVLLGVPLSRATKGAGGPAISGEVKYIEKPVPARNIVAILEGSDPKLRGEYVAIGGHNDHIGIRAEAVDHDSLHLYNQAREAIVGLVSRGQQATPEQLEAVRNIHINLDSVRKIRPVRMDSINNGADDDGSGTVTVLELAEAFAKLPRAERPKRSLLFVWHVGEENGLWGSRYVTDHPPVPRDSIVAQLNMDMVGRGEKWDFPTGGPNYLQLVGSRRLSTELGDLVETVNKTEKMPFRFDYMYDANGHPENIYCRSDHYNYARYGIPIVFFTTGLHGDYHQVTDEPEYIAYDHMARVGQLVYDIAVKVADMDHRPVVDKPKPDPNGRCQQ